ncbi:hypothetical protein JRQ81_006268 [Phrynocephalus forsythii]|uniref:Uncharacterized protein n=1 Tax=Phrynocephalus forsythii TaxID=171643 RepID=A0A9Q0XGG0_9SAUR|nr:hypothetical protein JRQ81_006268 [Phrynocephalus forsythii]
MKNRPFRPSPSPPSFSSGFFPSDPPGEAGGKEKQGLGPLRDPSLSNGYFLSGTGTRGCWEVEFSGTQTLGEAMASCAKSLQEKYGGKATPDDFLLQLAAALDNPTIKSLEWHEDGKGFLLHPRLYEDEIQKHQDLFPELRNLKTISALQTWLATYGFKARVTKTESDTLAFQHANFKRLSPGAMEANGPKAEALLKSEVPKQPKKSKKRKGSVDTLVTSSGTKGGALLPESVGVDRKSQRLRPLYQYINYDNPEMNKPPSKECDLNQQEAPLPLRNKTAPLKLKITSNTVTDDQGKEPKAPVSDISETIVKTEVDKSTQVDISKMLSVCAAHLVPPLSPQHK